MSKQIEKNLMVINACRQRGDWSNRRHRSCKKTRFPKGNRVEVSYLGNFQDTIFPKTLKHTILEYRRNNGLMFL